MDPITTSGDVRSTRSDRTERLVVRISIVVAIIIVTLVAAGLIFMLVLSSIFGGESDLDDGIIDSAPAVVDLPVQDD